jgi:Ca2+-binding RTX toxin-like protein
MPLNWKQVTSAFITNMYLYANTIKPKNLLIDSVIRKPDVKDAYQSTIEVDMASFMKDGPGRFANGSQSKIVMEFFKTNNSFIKPKQYGVYQEYTKDEIIKILFGKVDAVTQTASNIRLQQYDFTDTKNDLGERTYVWGSSGFTISKDAIFVIEADGTRHIKNYAIHALDDNFDFTSGNPLTQFGNNLILGNKIDPSRIGRTVKIAMTGKENVPTIDYKREDYNNDFNRYFAQHKPATIAEIYTAITKIADDLFVKGGSESTRFLTPDNKPVLYGTVGKDTLSATDIGALTHPTLYEYRNNGVALVAGAGDDKVVGGKNNDILMGGTGKDTLFGNEGNDTLNGGADNDFLDGGKNEGANDNSCHKKMVA